MSAHEESAEAQPEVENNIAIEHTPESKDTLAVKSEQSRTSRYTRRPTKLLIGPFRTCHYVSRHLLLATKWSRMTQVTLPDMDLDTGHTILHYLHTSTYQTLGVEASSPTLEACVEFKRALLVYLATIRHDLLDLQRLAMFTIEAHGDSLDIFEILQAIKDEFMKLGSDTWFHQYLLKKVRVEFDSNHTIFRNDSFLDSLGNAALNKFMMKCAMDLYDDKISHMLNVEKEMIQKLDERDETIRALSIAEAVPEHDSALQEDLIIPLVDEPAAEVCCGQEVLEESPASIDGFCTISCPSSEVSDLRAQCVDVLAICGVESFECTDKDFPDEFVPVEEYHESVCPAPKCTAEAVQIPTGDVIMPEPAEPETMIVQPSPEPVTEPINEPELSVNSFVVQPVIQESKTKMKKRLKRERIERESMEAQVNKPAECLTDVQEPEVIEEIHAFACSEPNHTVEVAEVSTEDVVVIKHAEAVSEDCDLDPFHAQSVSEFIVVPDPERLEERITTPLGEEGSTILYGKKRMIRERKERQKMAQGALLQEAEAELAAAKPVPEAEPIHEPVSLPEPSAISESKKMRIKREKQVRKEQRNMERMELLQATEVERTTAEPAPQTSAPLGLSSNAFTSTAFDNSGITHWGIGKPPVTFEPVPQEIEVVLPSPTLKFIDGEPLDAEPVEDISALGPVDDTLCPSRASHILEGNGWKTCRPCRAIVEQVIVQITRAGSGKTMD